MWLFFFVGGGGGRLGGGSVYLFNNPLNTFLYWRCNYFKRRRRRKGRKEGNVLFNDALNTFYFTVIWRRIEEKRLTDGDQSRMGRA